MIYVYILFYSGTFKEGDEGVFYTNQSLVLDLDDTDESNGTSMQWFKFSWLLWCTNHSFILTLLFIIIELMWLEYSFCCCCWKNLKYELLYIVISLTHFRTFKILFSEKMVFLKLSDNKRDSKAETVVLTQSNFIAIRGKHHISFYHRGISETWSVGSRANNLPRKNWALTHPTITNPSKLYLK